jgi:hypothetical protein
MYGAVVIRAEVIEVGFKTALRWGMVEGSTSDWRNLVWRLEDVQVSKLPPEHITGEPVRLREWWLDRLEFVSRSEYGIELRNGWTRLRYTAGNTWKLKGEVVTFGQPVPPATATPEPTTLAITPARTMEATSTSQIIPSATPPVKTEKSEGGREVVIEPGLVLLIGVVAIVAIGLATIYDWKRIGGKR